MKNVEMKENPKPPLVLFTMRDGQPREEKAFVCGECGSVYGTKESALYCHQLQFCESCKVGVPKGYIKCSNCRDQAMWDKAEEIQEWDGPVFDEHSERWFSSYDEAMEHFAEIKESGDEDAIPIWIQPCDQTPFPGLDLDGAIECMCDDMFEDAHEHLVGVDELENAVKIFNEKNKHIKSWFADTKKKIKVVLEEQP